ncbi:MAG: hypothetical protein MUC85_02665 [Anaerolineales bacterium]|jgi:hypothetical protein|nr:hypothetical protein [Anaerolineales bacterium]
MKKLNLILCVVLTLVIVTPAMAAPGEPVGELLDFIAEHQEFPANTPFHMDNGFVFSRDLIKALEFAPGHTSFTLLVDNEIIPESYWQRRYVQIDGVFYSVTSYVHNFPDGLPAGTYHFTGHWYFPCMVIQELGFTDECEYPNADFEWDKIDMVVVFK